MDHRLDVEIEQRELDTDQEDPVIEIVGMVSELEDKEMDEMTPLWEWVDGLIDGVFSIPPAPEAEAQVSFNYEGYRITVDQRGKAWFREQEG